MFQGPEFREFLLAKLLNAELACYKAEQFAKLEVGRKSGKTKQKEIQICSYIKSIIVIAKNWSRVE